MSTDRPGMDHDHVSILLDIKEEIGALNANMIQATHSRERMEKNLEKVKDEIAEIKPVVAEVSLMKPKVAELIEFKGRVGFYIWLAGAIVMGAITLLWQGISFFGDNIKRMFH